MVFKTTKVMTSKEYMEFNKEMNRLANITWKGYSQTLKEVGVTYLGKVGQSSKMMHSVQHHFDTYCVYLSSFNMSGMQVCNAKYTKNCQENCLSTSGQYRLSESQKVNHIRIARDIKARLFFANREIFMRLFCYELEKYKTIAEKKGHLFSCRINTTSDLNPEIFKVPNTNKNIIEYYDDVMFYDYTKVRSRINKLYGKYKNYFMVYSYDGSKESKNFALDYLSKGGHVAVVFATTKQKELPKRFWGYDVCNGDLYDYRPADIAPICGLTFKITTNNVKNGKIQLPNTEFVVKVEEQVSAI